MEKETHNQFSVNLIGSIADSLPTVPVTMKCPKIQKIFEQDPLTGLCVLNQNKPVGLIMKNKFQSILATRYGYDLYYNRPVANLMNANPLIVDSHETIYDVAKKAMRRGDDSVFDDIIITKDGEYLGIVRIRHLINYFIDYEKRLATQLNPLTTLPGNYLITETMSHHIQSKQNVVICYADLDRFKIYNDTYGFNNGDLIIKLTADILTNAINQHFPENSFVGHIGGDDFIFIIETEKPQKTYKLLSSIIKEFDENIKNCFNEVDRKNGYFSGYDRDGIRKCVPLTALSLATIYGPIDHYDSPLEIAERMSALKKETKKVVESNFIVISTTDIKQYDKDHVPNV